MMQSRARRCFVIGAFDLPSSFVIRASSFCCRTPPAPSAIRTAQGTNSNQELPSLHHLLAVKPNVKIAAYAVDVRFRNPVSSGVFGIWVTKRDVNSRNLLILKDVSDHMKAGCVC